MAAKKSGSECEMHVVFRSPFSIIQIESHINRGES